MPTEQITGEDGIILLKDTAGTVIGEVPCLKNWNLDVSASLSERGTKCQKSNGDGGSGSDGEWTRSTVESRTWSGNAEFYWQKDQTIPASVQLDPTNVGQKLIIELYPNDNQTDDIVYTGTAIIESASVPVPVEDDIMQTIQFKGDGPLTKAQVT